LLHGTIERRSRKTGANVARYSGAIFGSYELLDLIAAGGMGEVYRARHRRLQGREVAIKVMPAALASDPAFLQRFEREANSVAGLNHPHILPLWDYGEQDGAPYIVMPLVTGGSLRERLRAGPLTPAALVALIEPLASALDYAHARGIVHRDIKPANVLLDVEGQPYLADFGIAKALGPGDERLTRTGTGIGTPEYMAPEQVEGQAEARSDVYALGVIAYEGLTGRVPYTGNTPIDIAIKHLHAPLPPLQLPGGPPTPQLERTIGRALAKTPAERYASAGAFATDLARAVREAEAGRQTTSLPPVGRATAPLPRPAEPPPPSGQATGSAPVQPLPAASPAARSARWPFALALLAGLILGLAAAGGAAVWLANRDATATNNAASPGGTATATSATSADIPFPFPVTNARIASDYQRALGLAQREAADARLSAVSVLCYNPRANADCRTGYSFYSQAKDLVYNYAFSVSGTSPAETELGLSPDSAQRTVFLQLPWERNADWARLLHEGYRQLPADFGPGGFSAELGSDAYSLNRGEYEWIAVFVEENGDRAFTYAQRGGTVSKRE
jgi:serine/threonine kinase PknH